MKEEKGSLSINSENFLPIIKKWLYTDKDIFIRELISNGCDAISKHKKLTEAGSPDGNDYWITVALDKTNKTIQISDNGIGMTAEEIRKYINQIAYSGATEFLEKYKDKEIGDIIGHFGLGFYSAFMVSDNVEIESLSYIENSTPAKWVCDGGIEYKMSEGSRAQRGTTITLFIGKDGEEFLDETALRNIIEKYCYFMPVDIYLETADEEPDNEEYKKPLNDKTPLWLKPPNDCTKEEYIEFYHKVFVDINDPLFWIHLNMDYPLRLQGILYFPKLTTEMDTANGQIKLYSNQVYIADNVKEVVPEFLLILKGVMDCPDLPLNVSRSMLQNDGYAGKMSKYITKKVADKLNKLFKDDRAEYEGFFDDISIFIKYGCMKEEKLYEKIKDSIVYKTTRRDYSTLNEYLEKNKDKTGTSVFYASDENLQAQYINMFKDQDIEALLLTTPIDKHFVSYLEYAEKNAYSFKRIDADLSEQLKESDDNISDEEKENRNQLNDELQNLFTGILNMPDLKVTPENLKNSSLSAVILQSENSRRLAEMMEMYGGGDKDLKNSFKKEETLVLNLNNNIVKLLIKLKDDKEHEDNLRLLCEHIYDLAVIGYRNMDSHELTKFIERSNLILEKIINS